MPVLRNISLLVTGSTKAKQSEVKRIKSAAIVWSGERISWVGPESSLPDRYLDEMRLDAHGALAIPGLIDCHTHLAFAGWRADEFEAKILGKSYSEIAKSGGGIFSTVAKTRAASKDDLLKRCRGFLSEITCLGVTTIEVKSGYGLDVENELKLLEVYADLARSSALDIVATFLGAHTIPLEFKDRRKEYIALIVDTMLPEIRKRSLASFCDIFVESIAFSPDEARSILRSAQALGLRAKLHVDQLCNGSGAELAAELNAISADHLEFTSEAGIKALAKAHVVAVMLPFASMYAHQPFVDARKFLDAGVQVAVATDFNPGTAPSYHLPMCMSLACTMNRMTPVEALNGATIIAAKALDRQREFGSLEEGKFADIALIDAPDIEHWLYHLVPNACLASIKRGKVIWGNC